jgi:tRNA-(ms[2]io[6]A)-hydroxylase
MLGLKLATDPRWANIANGNLEEILTDHAFCEQKAASNAISMIVTFGDYSDLVEAMIELAQEEMQHFQMVHKKILDRGWVLGKERKDDYVNELYKFVRKGHKRNILLIDRLLFGAMIEARSCERFKILSENIADKELAEFYHELMISEANHYTLFLGFARKYSDGIDVDERWQEFLNYEASIMANYSKKESMHG